VLKLAYLMMSEAFWTMNVIHAPASTCHGNIEIDRWNDQWMDERAE
jgi:hypothetical protein